MTGDRVKNLELPSNSKNVTCAQCGRENLPDSKFCSFCGTKFAQAAFPFAPVVAKPGAKTKSMQESKAVKDEYVGALPAWDVLPPAIPVVRRKKRL